MNATAPRTNCSLTDLDWQVVEIARCDGPWSANPDGSAMRIRRAFGLPVARALTNERLEALRRFCVRAWHSNLIRARDLRPLVEAGYSSVDLSQILAHVAGHRGFSPSIEVRSI